MKLWHIIFHHKYEKWSFSGEIEMLDHGYYKTSHRVTCEKCGYSVIKYIAWMPQPKCDVILKAKKANQYY